MTQKKEGLCKSQPISMLIAMTDVDKVSRDLKPSPELFEMIQAAASSLTGFAQLWESIRKKGTHEGFTETQLQDLIKPLLKAQLHMSREQIWYMFNKEKKAITNREAYESRRINTPIVQKKELEEQEPIIQATAPEEIKQLVDEPEEGEEPTPLELAEIRIKQLEEALKKTEQFKPATALEQLPEVIKSAEEMDKEAHSWLKNSADGIGTFYYDAYGIDLFKNRELPQLKNSGVKVFRRLYFEV
jgi:hypothetical protein